MAFRQTATVGFSDLNQEGRLTLFSLCNLFQDTSSAHGEAAGQGSLQLLARKRAWFLAYGETNVYRRPMIGEVLQLETWPTKVKGFFGERAYVMKTTAGEVLADCSTIWVLMDMESLRPTRLTAEEMFREEPGEPLPTSGKGRKIEMPSGLTAWGEDRVNYLYLDSNCHMNNAYYVGLTEQFVRGAAVKRFRVEYRKSAVEGDFIRYFGRRQDDLVTVALENEKAEVFAVIEYELQTKDKLLQMDQLL